MRFTHRSRGGAGGGVSISLLLPLSHLFFCVFLFTTTWTSSAQQLNWADLEALEQIHYELVDLPGSTFFSTWDFSQDPCGNFAGVQCAEVNGDARVVILTLGSSSGGSPGLQGTLSPYVGNLTALVQLALVPGAVSGTIPSSLGSLSNLQFLGLSQNHFYGKIPSSFSNLDNLHTLMLDGNYLSSKISSKIGYLPSLITFSASSNQLSGAIPNFASAYSLQHLDLSTNQISGELQGFPSGIQYLKLGNNQLDGDISSVAGLSSLKYLDLSSNQLTGQIPYQVFAFTSLQYLLLDKNSLSGQLNIAGGSSIQQVDLSSNNLTGEVPFELGNVQQLSLDDNRLSGMVPSIFSSNLQTGVIQALHLQNNYLTGLSNLLAGMTLPPQVTLCFQYNCALAPPQSLCPFAPGTQVARPQDECTDSRNWS